MKKDWTMTPDSFGKLLHWLDEDSDRAGAEYQLIREKLIKIFISRGFFEAEDLADEVFNRIVSKIDYLSKEYMGEKSLYFFGVASKVILEANRKKETNLDESKAKAVVEDYQINPKIECLDECLEKLPPNQSAFILNYYQVEKSTKALIREDLAKQADLNISTLRVQVARIRQTLKSCVEECLKKC